MPLELILLLAGCETRRAALRESTRAALADTDFDRLVHELAARRLLPLIGARALEVGPDLVPQAFRDAVAYAVATARARGLAVEEATRAATASLAQAGIYALPLKGPLLAAEAHGDIGLRETADVDVLVDRSSLPAAVRVLIDAGFSTLDCARGGAVPLPELHVTLTHPRHPPIDVHWRVHWYETAFSEHMLQRAVPGPDGLLRARADDLAASMLLFYARDGFHGVRLAADLAAWWDRHRHGLGDGFLEGHTRSYPALAPSFTAAAGIVERITGAPSPSWLGAAARPGRGVALATRLADWAQQGDRDQLAANVSLVDGLLAPRGSRGQFARRELCLEGATPGRTVVHAAKMCTRYSMALWRVRRGRAWARFPLPFD